MPLSTRHQPTLDPANATQEASPDLEPTPCPTPVVLVNTPEPEVAQPLQLQPRGKRPLRWYNVTWQGGLLLSSVVGVLTLLAMPSFVGCGNKARQSEGKVTVTTMNRAQQDYFLKTGTFATSILALETGLPTETSNYQFSMRTTPKATFTYGTARPGTPKLRSFVGAVFVLPATGSRTPTIVSIACESTQPGTLQLADPILQTSKPTCAPGTRVLDLI